jgi:hypothetical protein
VTQIDLFDGDPSEAAYLAPDDDGAGQNTYTVAPIYAKGGHVTVRCHYGGDAVEDVALRKPIRRCVFSEGDAHPSLACR